VVYCLEGVDNTNVFSAVLPASARITAKARPDLLGGVTVLNITGAEIRGPQAPVTKADFTAIPYYTWNNRGNAPMKVWLPGTTH
jgi:hypothetical protein